MGAGAEDKLGRTRWTAHLSLPLNSSMEFKFYMVNVSDPEVMWEGGQNRLCSITAPGQVSFFPDELGLELEGASKGARVLPFLPAGSFPWYYCPKPFSQNPEP
ncbi:hypothetical protein T484DRAFT_2125890 [Baffinella frigidus]|nr:hypothetical protein T484DRAFT_2125890 [Cryptophyta sp. CCMP2293]